MKALLYTRPHEVILTDVPDPIPQEGEVLIRVDAVGICGSDMHAFHGRDGRRPPPLVLGHEASGRVMSGPEAGKDVVINPLVTCMRCDDCLSGRTNLCRNRQIISMPPREGAFAEYLRMPERNLVPLPEGLPPVSAALSEPVATAFHAVLKAASLSVRPLAESRVLVLGAGAVGLACALVLRSQGCRNILIGDTNPLRRATAQRAGAGDLFDPVAGPGPEANGFDVVLDAVGGAVTREAAVAAVKPGGIIVHIGLMDAKGEMDVRKITLQEVVFAGVYTYTMVDFRATVALLASGALGRLDWVEERALSDGAAAFADLDAGRTAAAKVVLRP